MQLAKRHDLGTEILQASSFLLFAGFVYHYFGPFSTATPGPEVFGGLSVCLLLIVATMNRPKGMAFRRAAPVKSLQQQQTKLLTEKLIEMDWRQLDELVGGVYSKLGAMVVPHPNSEGENNFGLVIERHGKQTAVMCKPWKKNEVTSPEIIEFSTAFKRDGLSHGIFVTVRHCTAPAQKVAETLGIDIVDQAALLQMLKATGEDHCTEMLSKLGCEPKHCPTCDNQMVLRTATEGLGAGEEFWGCSDFPQCQCTEPS